MPFQLLTVEGVADYLNLTLAELELRVRNREIPFEKRGKRIIFRKRDIEEWASRRVLDLRDGKLAAYHGKSSRHTKSILSEEAILAQMLQAGAVGSAMASKTRASVLADLAVLAGKTGHVCDSKSLLDGLRAREELCSTALPGGIAVPHARFHQADLFDTSFIVAGRTIQGIPFGAADGEPTHLFFLVCCRDDRLHLHALARVCLIARQTNVIEQLMDAPDAETMRQILIAAEQQILLEQQNKQGTKAE